MILYTRKTHSLDGDASYDDQVPPSLVAYPVAYQTRLTYADTDTGKRKTHVGNVIAFDRRNGRMPRVVTSDFLNEHYTEVYTSPFTGALAGIAALPTAITGSLGAMIDSARRIGEEYAHRQAVTGDHPYRELQAVDAALDEAGAPMCDPINATPFTREERVRVLGKGFADATREMKEMYGDYTEQVKELEELRKEREVIDSIGITISQAVARAGFPESDSQAPPLWQQIAERVTALITMHDAYKEDARQVERVMKLMDDAGIPDVAPGGHQYQPAGRVAVALERLKEAEGLRAEDLRRHEAIVERLQKEVALWKGLADDNAKVLITVSRERADCRNTIDAINDLLDKADIPRRKDDRTRTTIGRVRVLVDMEQDQASQVEAARTVLEGDCPEFGEDGVRLSLADRIRHLRESLHVEKAKGEELRAEVAELKEVISLAHAQLSHLPPLTPDSPKAFLVPRVAEMITRLSCVTEAFEARQDVIDAVEGRMTEAGIDLFGPTGVPLNTLERLGKLISYYRDAVRRASKYQAEAIASNDALNRAGVAQYHDAPTSITMEDGSSVPGTQPEGGDSLSLSERIELMIEWHRWLFQQITACEAVARGADVDPEARTNESSALKMVSVLRKQYHDCIKNSRAIDSEFDRLGFPSGPSPRTRIALTGRRALLRAALRLK